MNTTKVLIELEFESVYDATHQNVKHQLLEDINSNNLNWYISNPVIGDGEATWVHIIIKEEANDN